MMKYAGGAGQHLGSIWEKHNLTRQTERFPNLLDLFDVFIWDRAHCKRGGGFQKNKKSLEGTTFCHPEETNRIFYRQLSQAATAPGLLLVRRAALDTP